MQEGFSTVLSDTISIIDQLVAATLSWSDTGADNNCDNLVLGIISNNQSSDYILTLNDTSYHYDRGNCLLSKFTVSLIHKHC